MGPRHGKQVSNKTWILLMANFKEPREENFIETGHEFCDHSDPFAKILIFLGNMACYVMMVVECMLCCHVLRLVSFFQFWPLLLICIVLGVSWAIDSAFAVYHIIVIVIF